MNLLAEISFSKIKDLFVNESYRCGLKRTNPLCCSLLCAKKFLNFENELESDTTIYPNTFPDDKCKSLKLK